MNEATEYLLNQATGLLKEIHYKEGYKITVGIHGDFVYLQVHCWRPDKDTGVEDWGHGGKGYLLQGMSDSSIIRTAFSLFLAYETHECREFFQWNGRSIFGPHMDIEQLWLAAATDLLDYK